MRLLGQITYSLCWVTKTLGVPLSAVDSWSKCVPGQPECAIEYWDPILPNHHELTLTIQRGSKAERLVYMCLS